MWHCLESSHSGVGECTATDCLSTAPAYLFAHSAMDRPVHVGKGSEEPSRPAVLLRLSAHISLLAWLRSLSGSYSLLHFCADVLLANLCRDYFLFVLLICVVTTEKPVQASLYQVKKAEKEREGFKKKMSWALRQLKLFDAKYINKVSNLRHKFCTIM